MWQNNTRVVLIGVLVLALLLTVIFGILASRQTPPPPSPTVDIGRVQTQAVSVFSNGLTSTALAVPTSTATDTPEPTETAAAVEATATGPTSAVSPTPSCYKLKFLQDLTVPDYTVMAPATVFTKSWQVQNTGTCAWQPGFQVILVGGVAMGGSPYKVSAAVNPGAKVEISIKMAAPANQTGLIQGTWRMVDLNGNQFGNVMTVNIVIPGGTATP